jgi:sugar lactone lactonase YvrE
MSRNARVLCGGVYFGEGPRWRQGRLWFSDFYGRAVKSVSLAGDVRLEVELDDSPSGLGWTPDGAMLIVSMAKRRVLRRAPAGAVTVHADLSQVATFLSNDMVADASGGAYVGDFGFDFHAEVLKRGELGVFADHPTTKLARIAPDGAVTVAADDMHFPNGSVITPDDKTLIVGETLGAC